MKVKKTMSGSEAVWKFEFWNSKLLTVVLWISLTCLPSSVYSQNNCRAYLPRDTLEWNGYFCFVTV